MRANKVLLLLLVARVCAAVDLCESAKGTCTLASDHSASSVDGDVEIAFDGTVIVKAKIQAQRIKIRCANLHLQANAILNVTGGGAASGKGTGAGIQLPSTSSGGGVGGTFGGGGGLGTSSDKAAGKSYGDMASPTDLGSGGQLGRYRYSYNSYSSAGGAGGGAIEISVGGGTLKLDADASIVANGEAGQAGAVGSTSHYGRYCGGGGGSGGSVVITASEVVGSGVIAARGGAGGKGGIKYGSTYYAGGGGGGGRVAIRASSLDSQVIISARGGAAGEDSSTSMSAGVGKHVLVSNRQSALSRVLLHSVWLSVGLVSRLCRGAGLSALVRICIRCGGDGADHGRREQHLAHRQQPAPPRSAGRQH